MYLEKKALIFKREQKKKTHGRTNLFDELSESKGN